MPMLPRIGSSARLLIAALAVLAAATSSIPAEAQAMLHTKVGDRVRVITLADLSGTPRSTDASKGRPRVIAFFTTWSPRSAELLEDLKRLHPLIEPKGVRVLAVCVDGENLSSDRRAAIGEYAKHLDLPFPVLLDDGLAVYSAWGVVASPTTVLADAEEEIVYILAGYPSTFRQELEDRILALAGIASEVAAAPPVVQMSESQRLRIAGMNLLGLGQTDKALAFFVKAAAADTTSVEPVIMMIRVHLQQGDNGPAGDLLAKVTGDALNRPDFRFLKGLHALYTGNSPEASATFEALAKGYPAEGWGAWGAALAALAANNVPEGIAHLRAAGQLAPPDPLVTSLVFAFARSLWSKGTAFRQEDNLVAVFPELDEVRAKYRRMFGGNLAPAP